MKTEDLLPFCSKNPERPNIAEPFTRDGYTYATDGIILVRVPEIPGVVGHEKAPDPTPAIPDDVNFVRAPLPQNWQAIPNEMETCKECRGTGRETKECPDCKGEGEITCECCGQFTSCGRCGGSGSLESHDPRQPRCEYCEGSGQIEKHTPILLDGGIIVAAKQKLLQASGLPGFRNLRYRSKHTALLADFDHGLIVLMPMDSHLATDALVAAQWPDHVPTSFRP